MGAGVTAGMGGGGAGGTALLARRSWLLVRGQRGVNGAAGEAQVVSTVKPCRWKNYWGGGRGGAGGLDKAVWSGGVAAGGL